VGIGEIQRETIPTRGIRSASSVKPLLRWAGSKRKSLHILLARTPRDIRRYIEPFSGSACLFFALRPKDAILSDINQDLIETYETVREHPRHVYGDLTRMPTGSDHYYHFRSQDPTKLGKIRRAARFIYLNRFCFNGVYRTNRSGQFNVPIGRNTGGIPSIETFIQCSRSLRNAELRTGDFEDCMRDARRGDFVYLDPPYTTTKSRFRGEYGYNSFGVSDLDRFIASLDRLQRKGVRFMLSYAENTEMKRAVSHWNCTVVRMRVRRHVAGFREHRKNVSEILISNY
jgi:DNA adenine methylase